MIKAKLKIWGVALFFTVSLGLLPAAPRLAYGSAYQAKDSLSSSLQLPAPPDYEGAEAPLHSPDPVEPGQARFGVYDRNTPDITLDFPKGSVSKMVEVKAYYDTLPANVSPPPGGMKGSPFYLGAWVGGESRTVDQFNQSIVIHARYDERSASRRPGFLPFTQEVVNLAYLSNEGALALLGSAAPLPFSLNQALSAIPVHQEEQVHLSMYDPTTQEWLELCSRTDPYDNVVSGALLLPTPLEAGGNALLAVTIDNTPALEQSTNPQGDTVLSVPGKNARLNVAPGTVEVGTFFEVTELTKASAGGGIQLLPTPIDVKACQAGENNDIRQINQISRPLVVEFTYDAATVNRAGGPENITIAQLENGQWVDLEELGTRVIRDNPKITAEISRLGAFGMVIR